MGTLDKACKVVTFVGVITLAAIAGQILTKGIANVTLDMTHARGLVN